MAWKLPTNYNTNTLGDITTSITKESLRTGDILLRKGTHVTIFDSWVDASKTKYWGYEESSSKGAVYRQIPYGYFDHADKYLPRRFNNIEWFDDLKISRKNKTFDVVMWVYPLLALKLFFRRTDSGFTTEQKKNFVHLPSMYSLV